MQRRRSGRSIRLVGAPSKQERWAKLVCLAFIPQKISELQVMREWSFAGMINWQKNCAFFAITEWIRATSTVSSEEIFAWTKSRRQFWRLNFRNWKVGQQRGVPLLIFTAQNSHAPV